MDGNGEGDGDGDGDGDGQVVGEGVYKCEGVLVGVHMYDTFSQPCRKHHTHL